MKLLKNKQQTGGNASSDKAANWLASGIAKVQGYWAKGMDKVYNRLSARWKKITLIGTCLIMALYSTAVIAFSFNRATALIAKPIAAIRPLSINSSPNEVAGTVPSYMMRINHFKNYLDSLSHTLDGRRIRDSILERRPGLLDSIRQIEIIYSKK